ncbi:type II secretion system protein GspL [Thalassolituus oleivorans]|uniref:type II secretion system protein GspL n=1 Tax=Thalassolituus oleivorans TaxID=187493 RepID=UPI0023F09F78|nr:type II secretion system protein GspL [Thalassolituus oleivorans]MDF1642309.1 type II secretion system protein GspL [Thalassolituus oleivorans]
MTTNAIRVQWHATLGQWTVHTNQEVKSLEEWADTLPELTAVTLQLSASNYVAHWVSLPGIKARMVNRAMPYALEELILGDLNDFTVLTSGSYKTYHRAYVVANDITERLLDLCELHHVRVQALVPETAALPLISSIQYDAGDWLIQLPGRFEGRVPEGAIAAVLESVLADFTADELIIVGNNLDQANLLKTSIETGYPDCFASIRVEPTSPALLSIPATADLLSGKGLAQQETHKANKWWAGIAAMTAVFAVLSGLYLFADNRLKAQQVAEVRSQSLALYKQWFPGERVRSLERQFREKLDGGATAGSGGFIAMMANVSRVYASASLQKSIELQSVRYADRLDELVIEVTATAMGDLQTFKQALEKSGMTADIASATTDKGVVKGRLKVGGAAA